MTQKALDDGEKANWYFVEKGIQNILARYSVFKAKWWLNGLDTYIAKDVGMERENDNRR